MFIFFVEFICARSSSKFLWQWNDTLSNACPATYEVAMAKGHLMTSQTAVFANPFVTSQRALSDNPIDDVTDSTVLNAIGIDTKIEVIVASPTTWEAHHSPRAKPEGCGELPRSLVTQQWPKWRYQLLFYHDETKSITNKQKNAR